jgi:magnesium-transporting ATPase (P-type)
MSVIIRDTDGIIKILSKGADTTMIPRLHPNQDIMINITNKHLEDYCLEGLRCLLVCYAEISDQDYLNFHLEYKIALCDFHELDKRKKGEDNYIDTLENIVEQNLKLLGATALEDRFVYMYICVYVYMRPIWLDVIHLVRGLA